MKHQKMMTWVSISGIALSVFLATVFFMTDRLDTVEVSPESNRSRMLYGGSMHIESEDNSSNGYLSYKMADRLYSSLDGIEEAAYSSNMDFAYNVGVKGKPILPLTGKKTDSRFWNLYDFRFLSGKPYDDNIENSVIINRSMAHKFFDKEDATGETLYIDNRPYTVSGVIEDVNPILKATFSNFYIPFSTDEKLSVGNEYFGEVMVHLLMKPGADPEAIRKEVERRYQVLSGELSKNGETAIYHNEPHPAEYLAADGVFSAMTPDLSKKKARNYIIYFILLLVPAINLSCMMRGRLKRRVSEIGVRRVFGAKRHAIIMQILTENFVMTLVGGAIGLILAVVFIMNAYGYFFSTNGILYDASFRMVSVSAPSFGMLFTWGNFFFTLLICFLLNLMSGFIPAWKASGVEPAKAINS